MNAYKLSLDQVTNVFNASKIVQSIILGFGEVHYVMLSELHSLGNKVYWVQHLREPYR